MNIIKKLILTILLYVVCFVETQTENKMETPEITQIITELLPNNTCVLLVITSKSDQDAMNNTDTSITDENLQEIIENQTDSYITDQFISSINFSIFIERFDNITRRKKCTPTSFIVIVTKTSENTPEWYKFQPHVRILFVFINPSETINNLWSTYIKDAKYHDVCVFTWSITKWPPDLNNIQIITRDMNQTVTYTSLEHQCTHQRQIVFKPGTNLKVLGFELAPYFTLVQPPDLTIPNGHVSGLEVELLNLLTTDWPVEIEIRPMYSWDEILADLENHKADVGLSAIWQSRILSNDLDFLHPYMGVTSTFLVPDAMLLPKETYVFQSLSIGVWLIIFVAIILISQVIKYIAKWHERRPVDNYLMMALSYYAINSTTSQAHSKFFHAVVLMWSFASLLLNTSYSAGFTSIENVPPTTKPINTFQDAIDRQLRCYSLGDFSQGLLRASMEPDKMKFADMMIILETTPPIGVCTGVDLLLNSYVFAGYKLTNTDLVTLKLLLDNIQSTYNVFAVARNSPYFRDLDTRMIMLKEYGFVSGMLKKYSGDQSLQDLKDFNRNLFSDRDYTAKEFKEVQGVFYLLMIGSTLALFCFIGEWVKARYTNGEILRIS